MTFLFTDIEGSTERWERNSGEMSVALARHDALMRAAVEARGGYVFKTVGDAFCVGFSSAADAMAAALNAQRNLATEDFSSVSGLRVRMALHSGTAEEREGDYFGPSVNRVARLLAIGHGGQVLVSGTAAELLENRMPAGSTLRDLGSHRLRDLAQPERVYQVIAPGLQEAFPPLRSLDHLSNNLPAQLTSFVGRDRVASEIKTLIEQHRLVTLTGTGGSGKTRCAIHIGAELLDGSADGVWLAELAPISDPTLVPNVVALALNLQEQPNRPMIETLIAYLKRKRLLLILDNCEHVIEEARQLAGAILRECPEVSILATSREPLNIAGEASYRVPSLAVPSSVKTLLAEGASRYGAVQLFIDRALLSDNRFVFSQENAPYVADVCRRLDGIPLAIELAAARIKVLAPRQLAQKLDERFRVLTGGDRAALPRQQTMRALIDWSYGLLSNDERALFRKLSVFAGGFSLETAAAVCGESGVDELAVLDLLASLVDKSLVQADPSESATRYRLLESMRQYAREKLEDAGESEAIAQAHARAFLALAQQFDDAWETTPDRTWFVQVEPELENFLAALSWAFGARGDVVLGQRLAGTLRWVWVHFGAATGRRWIETAREHVEPQTSLSVLAALDLAEAQLAGSFFQIKASLAAAERALARYRELGDPLRTAEAEWRVGRALTQLGKIDEGEALLRQAPEKARELGARKSVSFALRTLALARTCASDVAGARELFREALAAARDANAEREAAIVAGNLADIEFEGGDIDAALELGRESLEVLRVFHNALNVAIALSNQAAYLAALGRYGEARESAREALDVSRDAHWPVGVAFALQYLAAVDVLTSSSESATREKCARAARLIGYTNARLGALEAVREFTEQQNYDTAVHVLRDTLGEADLSKLMAEGSSWSEEHAITEALLI